MQTNTIKIIQKWKKTQEEHSEIVCYLSRKINEMALIDINTTVEIDTDDIIDEISTYDLIEELRRRQVDIKENIIRSKKDYTLFETEKIEFFMENLEKISFSDLEKIIN